MYLQQLLYLLPPCNCDTLLKLLNLLHTVQEHAHDSVTPGHQEVTHNIFYSMSLCLYVVIYYLILIVICCKKDLSFTKVCICRNVIIYYNSFNFVYSTLLTI